MSSIWICKENKHAGDGGKKGKDMKNRAVIKKDASSGEFISNHNKLKYFHAKI